MRKFLLFLLLAILMPVGSYAENMALQKTQQSNYPFRGSEENRLVIPYSALGYESATMTGQENYTFGMWINLTEVGYEATYATKGGSIANFCNLTNIEYAGNWGLAVMQDGTVEIVGKTGLAHSANQAGFAGVIDAKFPFNEWVYVAVVVDNQNLKAYLYLNDQCVKETAMAEEMYYNASDGYFQAGGYRTSCLIDEVQLYNQALSAKDVKVAMLNPTSIASLQSLYSFDEAVGTGKFDNTLGNGVTTQAEYLYFKNSGTTTWTKNIKLTTDGGGISSGTNTAQTPTLVVSDREVLAATVQVTVDPNLENGTLIVKNGDEVLGASAQVATGADLTIEAQPAEGYKLVDLYAVIGEERQVIGSTYQALSDVMLSAQFTNTLFTLSVENPGEVAYTLSRRGEEIDDPTSLMGGVEYQLTLVAPEDKKITAVKLGEETLEATDGVYTIVLNADATLAIEVQAKEYYTITIEATEGGTVTVLKNGEALKSGAQVYEQTVLNVTPAPNPGYTFLTLKANGEELAGETYTVTGNVTFSADYREGIDYCEPTPVAGRNNGTQTTYGGRGVSTLEVSCDDMTVKIAGRGTAAAVKEVYLDQTALQITAMPGSKVTVKVEGAGEWMNTFLYVDFDRNGLTTDDKVFGNFTGNSNVVATTIEFNVPYDAAAATYRVRYKLDWFDQDPCVYGEKDKDNGEAVIDFSLVIPSQDYDNARLITLAADNEYGSVAFVDPATEGNSLETSKKKVTVEATPAEGAAFINWTNADGRVMSESAEFTYEGEEAIDLIAHFGFAVNVTVEGEGKANLSVNNITVRSGVVVAPGSEITLTTSPATGKALLSVMVNDELVVTQGGMAVITVNSATTIKVEFGEKPLTFNYTVSGNGRVYVCTGMEESEEENEDGEYPYVPAGEELAGGTAISSASRVYVFLVPDENEEIVSLIETQGDEVTDVTDDVEAPEDGPYALADGTPAYVYTPSFSGEYNLDITFSGGLGAIDSIITDGEAGELEFFNLEGVRVAADNLVPGIYVVRQGAVTTKVLVK